MSAYVVSKVHIDLLVRAAEHYGGDGTPGARMQWWRVDEDSDFVGWRYLVSARTADPSEEENFTPSQLGQVLVDENVRSVVGRYPDTDADLGDLPGPTDAYYMGPYVYADPGVVLSPAEVFKAIDCLDYQSCEHDGWRRSEAFFFLEALREKTCQALPGYDDAPWGFDEAPARAEPEYFG